MRKQNRRHTSRVRLESQEQNVIYELNVFRVLYGNADRCLDGRNLGVAELFSLLDARFDVAHAGQVLIELTLVLRTEAPLHGARVFEDEIEHRPFLLATALQIRQPLARRPGAKKPLKDQAR